MPRPHEGSNKKDREKAMVQKRKEKEQRKEERKANSAKGKSLDDMIAYVDAYGNIVSTPPDPSMKEEVSLDEIQISVSRKENMAPESRLRTGTVTFFNDSRGFGFIRDDETRQSIFLHVNNLTGTVRENDRVTYETEKGPKGLSAVNVKLA